MPAIAFYLLKESDGSKGQTPPPDSRRAAACSQESRRNPGNQAKEPPNSNLGVKRLVRRRALSLGKFTIARIAVDPRERLRFAEFRVLPEQLGCPRADCVEVSVTRGTRTKFGPREDWKSQLRYSGRGSSSPRLESFFSEDAEHAAGCDMALDVESILDGGVNRQEALG